MIYINIYYKQSTEQIPSTLVYMIKVTYPNEEDFMKEREVRVYTPPGDDKYITLQKGVYVGMTGFQANTLSFKAQYDGRTVTESLPMQSCIIREYWPALKES